MKGVEGGADIKVHAIRGHITEAPMEP